MTSIQMVCTIFAIMLVFMAVRVPIAISMFVAGAYGYIAQTGWLPFANFLNNQAFARFASYDLSVIPLFILMGHFATQGGISKALFDFAAGVMGRFKGGLAMAAVLACAAFGAICGSSVATAATITGVALPELKRHGYSGRLATGTLAAAGTLGILIPPSILLIVYAATASVSVVKMYAAAIIPGFTLAFLYLLYIIVRATLNPSLCPKPKDVYDYSVWESIVMVLKAFVPLAVLIMSVLGSILFGLATPSEAAAMGVLGGIILAIVYRAFTWERLRESVYLTARTSAMVCFLFVGSATFASVFGYLGGEHLVKDFMLALDLSPLQFLLLSQFLIFILGWPLEWSEIIIIFVPIFLPLLPLYNIDPILFGILIAVNLQTAFLTPPMAMSAYYLKGVAPKSLQLNTIFSGCMPFVYIILFTLAMTYVFPAMVTYLPDQFFNQSVEMERDPNDESVVNPDFFKTN